MTTHSTQSTLRDSRAHFTICPSLSSASNKNLHNFEPLPGEAEGNIGEKLEEIGHQGGGVLAGVHQVGEGVPSVAKSTKALGKPKKKFEDFSKFFVVIKVIKCKEKFSHLNQAGRLARTGNHKFPG